MLTIAVHGLFQEHVRLENQDRLEITAELADNPQLRRFRFVLPATSSSDPLQQVAETFRLHEGSLAHTYPLPEWEGSWFSFRSEQKDRRVVIALDTQLATFPDLRDALEAFDRGRRIAPTSVRNWLQCARDWQAKHDFSVSFRCARAALERSKLPYIRIVTKDDTGLKFHAAQSTFDAGQQEQAVHMVMQLAEARLRLLEKASQESRTLSE